MSTARHRVVLIGGGFAGLACARALKRARVDVKLLDRRNFHLFQPLLYQVATGSLSPGDICAPLRAVLRGQKNTQVLLAEATGFDVEKKLVILADGEVSFDTLVVAAGAEDHYFGKDDWSAYAPGLKSIEDATRIRQRIFRAFEAAEREPDPERRRAWLRFVIVGGGPTGAELAGAIAEIARDTLRDNFRLIRPEESEILLIEGSPRVLPPFPEELSDKAERALLQLGVRCLTGVRVTHVDASGVEVGAPPASRRIDAQTILWAAGVRANGLGRKLAEQTGCAMDREGRLAVGPDLTIAGHPEIFVLGDLAACKDAQGRPLPGVAPVAMQQGRYAAKSIMAGLRGETVEPFRYWNKGNLATIGRNHAVADFGFLRLHGTIAWLAWLFIHLLYIVGFRNRVLVAIQWGFQYLTFNRGARLITGDINPPAPGREQRHA